MAASPALLLYAPTLCTVAVAFVSLQWQVIGRASLLVIS
jgi:hypothetical protein